MATGPILVIDDNPLNLKLIVYYLNSKGYEVHTARDAEEALQRVASLGPRLILMDVQLPGMDGLELTRILKENPETRDILIIAVTAYAMKSDEERALSAGCDGYLSKPVDRTLLISVVERLMQGELRPA